MNYYTRDCKECGKTIEMRKRPGGKWVAYEDDGTGFNTIHFHKKRSPMAIDTKKESVRSSAVEAEWDDSESVEEEEIEEEDEEPPPYSGRRNTRSYTRRVASHERKSNVGSVVTIILGLLTLISLIFPQFGEPTDNLIQPISQLIGWGIYILPVGLIVIGLWLLSSRENDPLSLKRMVGIVLFFVWLLAIMDLILLLNATQSTILDGTGGGSIGKFFAQMLFNSFTTSEVTIVLVAWLLVAVILVFDIACCGVTTVLGFLILIILASPQHSPVIAGLIQTIVKFIGWGTAILPIGLIVTSLWLLSSQKNDLFSPRRMVGIVLFFIWLLTVMDLTISLNATQQAILDGIGGGSIGHFFKRILADSFSTGEVTIALLTWLLVTLIMMFDIDGSGITIVLGLLTLMIIPPRTELTENILQITGGLLRWTLYILPVGLIAVGLWVYSRLRLPGEQRPFIEDVRELLAKLNIHVKQSPLNENTEIKTSEPAAKSAVPAKESSQWQLPAVKKSLDTGNTPPVSEQLMEQRTRLISEALAAFGTPVKIVEINGGPTVTQFCVEPLLVKTDTDSTKVRMSKIAVLADDLALALTVPRIRIQAPVPGQSYAGIEVPNDEIAPVALRDIVESEPFQSNKSQLRMALGSDMTGHPVVAALETMPHLLTAGANGSGKSVFIHAVLTCFLSHNTPDDLRLMLVDPKRTELTGYNGIPHLLSPVVVEIDRVIDTLQSMTREMDKRYDKFEQVGSRTISEYNAKMKLQEHEKIPYLVIVINELADLMLASREKIEQAIIQLAQLGRAAGIHLILATERLSEDVITGLIKANFPTRIAFSVASGADSKVILDQPGAERLLGHGDMLFQAADASAPVRLQGAFVSDQEVQTMLESWRVQMAGIDPSTKPAEPGTISGSDISPKQSEPSKDVTPADTDSDPLLPKAIDLVRREGRASVYILQRWLRIGYTRAARIIDTMEDKGIVGPPKGKGQVRQILDQGTTNLKEQKVTSRDQKKEPEQIRPIPPSTAPNGASLSPSYVILADKPGQSVPPSIEQTVSLIEKTLAKFDAKVIGVHVSSTMTQFSVRYTLHEQTTQDEAPDAETLPVQITSLSKDLASALSVKKLDIEFISKKPYIVIKLQKTV